MVTGQESLKLVAEAKSTDLAAYFYDLACDAHHEGYQSMTLILDNNGTHKDKMRYELWLQMKANPASPLRDFGLNFMNTPRYSPDFNLAEYLIHQLRLQLLHHLPAKVTLAEIKQKVTTFLQAHHLQTPQQILNTINHILNLGRLDYGI